MASDLQSCVRRYGQPPYRVVLLHGGPGACGEMAPVAKRLSRGYNVLEPFGTATSLDGQVEELKSQLESFADLPVVIAGYSWGAWLGFIFAARYPALVRKLILIASGPFDEKYVPLLHQTRKGRLSEAEKQEVETLSVILEDSGTGNKAAAFARFGEIFKKTDMFDPINEASEPCELLEEVYRSVWPEAAELRRTGKLLAMADQIQCPVTAIHGDFDPHPAAGVEEPLAARLKTFRFVLLDHCGHTPWRESRARERFFHVLHDEIMAQTGSDS